MKGHVGGANHITHGRSNSRMYRTWQSMKYRCHTPTCKDYALYGGRGIEVCCEWRNSFESFYAWAISNGYSDDLTIDRIDPNGNYNPSNCRWVTIKDQQSNKRNNVSITVDGRTMTATQWSVETGVCYTTILTRLKSGKVGNELFGKG